MTEDTTEQLGQALQTWQAGNQQPAIDQVRPLAEAEDLGALLAISWMYHQQGAFQQGLPFAIKAAEKGNPWVLGWYFGHLADNPETRAQAAELVALNPMGGVPTNDPVGRAFEFAGQGDLQGAERMLRAAAGPHPWPYLPDKGEVERRLSALSTAASEVDDTKSGALSTIQGAMQEVEMQREKFETRGNVLGNLLTNITNAAAQFHFDKRAAAHEKESHDFWLIGVCVLSAAAIIAILPVFLDYTGWGDNLSGQTRISAHIAATLAFATVAGVLLARARSRDREGQRNRDLAVALETMFAYSGEIENPEEQAKFKQDMGRLVLEAFLRQAPPEDTSRGILGAVGASPTAHVPGS
jgi:hypothetical protein